MTSDVRI